MVLVVRYEGSGGRVQAQRVNSPARRTRPRRPFALVARGPREGRVAGLVCAEEGGERAFVRGRQSGEHADALRGYDNIIATIETAARGRRGRPSAPAPRRSSSWPRAANRARVPRAAGGRQNLQRAEDDCREALEGPFTAWLRQKLRPSRRSSPRRCACGGRGEREALRGPRMRGPACPVPGRRRLQKSRRRHECLTRRQNDKKRQKTKKASYSPRRRAQAPRVKQLLFKTRKRVSDRSTKTPEKTPRGRRVSLAR